MSLTLSGHIKHIITLVPLNFKEKFKNKNYKPLTSFYEKSQPKPKTHISKDSSTS